MQKCSAQKQSLAYDTQNAEPVDWFKYILYQTLLSVCVGSTQNHSMAHDMK